MNDFYRLRRMHTGSRIGAYPQYNSSKTALNAVTVAFAKELAAFGIAVNAADPGYTATDFNGHSGYRTVEQATGGGIVWLATRNPGDATGRFYFERDQIPW